MITIQMTAPSISELIELPDLTWSNEFSWNKVVQTVTHGVTGSLFVQTSEKLKGREIVLTSLNDMGWITRETIEKIKEIRETINHEIELIMPNDDLIITTRTFTVIFSQDTDGLNVQDVKGFDDYKKNNYFRINSLKFIEI